MSVTSSVPDIGRTAIISRFRDRHDTWTSRGCPLAEAPTPWFTLSGGTTGIAHAYRVIGEMTGDEALLRQARQIIDFTLDNIGELTLPEECLGLRNTASVFHSIAGTHVVRALICDRMEDVEQAMRSVGAFCFESDRPIANEDLMIGRGGSLLGGALLLSGICHWREEVRAALADFCDELYVPAVKRIDRGLSGATEATGDMNFAHGLAGRIYALLRYAEIRGFEIPAALESVLDALARRAKKHPAGGSFWDPAPSAAAWGSASWCNGSAGHVDLWLTAARAFDRPDYVDLAADAAFHAGQKLNVASFLCCGLVGQAYALCAVWRATNESLWYERAVELAELSAQRRASEPYNTPEVHGLFTGDAGASLLYVALKQGVIPQVPIVTS